MREYTNEEQELIRQGQLAEAALTNPALASAFNELSEQLRNAIVNTQPNENDKREKVYYLHAALKELVGILNYRVNLKNGIEAEKANDEEIIND